MRDKGPAAVVTLLPFLGGASLISSVENCNRRSLTSVIAHEDARFRPVFVAVLKDRRQG